MLMAFEIMHVDITSVLSNEGAKYVAPYVRK